MLYARFFCKSVDYDGKHPVHPIEACGDRSVIILDARRTMYNQHLVCIDECRKRGYIGYQLMRGESFTRSSPVGKF